jgi:hypothetical protein
MMSSFAGGSEGIGRGRASDEQTKKFLNLAKKTKRKILRCRMPLLNIEH